MQAQLEAALPGLSLLLCPCTHTDSLASGISAAVSCLPVTLPATLPDTLLHSGLS